MKINEVRYRIIEKLFFGQPLSGWTVESLHHSLNSQFDADIPIKSIRTFTNNLIESKIIESVKSKEDGKTKRLYLNKEALKQDETISDQYKMTMSILVSMLQSMKASDLGSTVDSLLNQLSYTFEDYDDWFDILDASGQILWFHQPYFESSEKQLQMLAVLMANKKCLFVVEQSSGISIRFLFNRVILRSGVILLTGINVDTSCYEEINLFEIKSIKTEKAGVSKPKLHPREKNKLDNAHLSIGAPAGTQVYQIVLKLNEEALSKLKNKTLGLDAEINVQDMTLGIHHELSAELVDWIIGLGSGVTVTEPQELKERILDRLYTIANQYSN